MKKQQHLSKHPSSGFFPRLASSQSVSQSERTRLNLYVLDPSHRYEKEEDEKEEEHLINMETW